MKRSLLAVLFAVIAVASAQSPASSAETEFREGMAALPHDFASGLHLLELAIADDPDNLRYACEYRQAIVHEVVTKSEEAAKIRDHDEIIILNKYFDRSIEFFGKMVAAKPESANLHLNYGFAYVDKIPTAPSIVMILLANNALGEFTKAVDLQPDWLNYYTRGKSYLFWPKVFFDKPPLAVADLEKAVAIQRSGPTKPYYLHGYLDLGDGYCKMEQMDKARSVWEEGLRKFPGSAELKQRLSSNAEQLALIVNNFDPAKRINTTTDLREIWSNGQ